RGLRQGGPHGERRGDPGVDERQPLPLRGLPRHPRRRQGGGRQVNPFEYKRAKDIPGAVALGTPEGAKYLAGGTNLIDLMKYDVERHDTLVDITRLDDAKITPMADGGAHIGALVRNSDLAADPRIVTDFGLLSKALLSGASPQ